MSEEESSNTGLESLNAAYTDSEGEDHYPRRPIQSGTSTPADVATPSKDSGRRLVEYETPPIEDEEDNMIEDMDISEDDMDKGNTSPAIEQHSQQPQAQRSSKALQEKIRKYYVMMLEGRDMNSMIEDKKEFRNPSIYEKLIEFCDIDELGSNYPVEKFDPFSWKPESYYEELAKAQKEEMEKREKERRERTKVDIVSVTKKNPPPSDTSDPSKRRSKWDQVGPAMVSLPPAGLLLNPVKLYSNKS